MDNIFVVWVICEYKKLVDDEQKQILNCDSNNFEILFDSFTESLSLEIRIERVL